MVLFALLLGLLAGGVCSAQNGHPKKKQPATPPRATGRARMDSTAQRNENVIVYLIDNNTIKEAGIRSGDLVTIVPEQPVEASYYATEHGRPPAETVFVRPVSPIDGWHGEFYEGHQNSVFNSRTFFQVGPVKPAHRNLYGGRVTGLVPGFGYLTMNAGQRKIRGMVNGNVLVPLADERTPRTTDPVLRPLIERFLKAYPAELPNRPDFDPRALNTNSPQRIDATDASVRLDPTWRQPLAFPRPHPPAGPRLPTRGRPEPRHRDSHPPLTSRLRSTHLRANYALAGLRLQPRQERAGAGA